MPSPEPPDEGLPSLNLENAWKAARSELKRLTRYVAREGERVEPITLYERCKRCCEYCEDVIFKDLEFAFNNKVEDKLWEIYVEINAWYRKRLDQFKDIKAKDRKVVEGRKVHKKFLEFVKFGQSFYRNFIQTLALKYGGIPELQAIAQKLNVKTSTTSEVWEISAAFHEMVLLSCCMNLSRLGDLSRWREEQRESGEPEWAHAIGYYDLAGYLRPQSGRPHHQRAVVARATQDSSLKVLYWFYRALICAEPYPTALKNIELLYDKICKSAPTMEPHDGHSAEGRMSAPDMDLTDAYVLLHARLHLDLDSEQTAVLERVVMRELYSKDDAKTSSTYKKIVLVNLAAEVQAMKECKENPGYPVFRCRQLRLFSLNASTFEALLIMVRTSLKDVVQEPAAGDGNRRLSDNITAMVRRLMPAIRLYCSWLTYTTVTLEVTFGDDAGDTMRTAQHAIRSLWSTFADVWNLLVNMFPLKALLQSPDIDYLFEEDEETLGFLPFQQNPIVAKRFRDPSTGNMKPRLNNDGERHHPNVEMLGRIRDFITDGAYIAEEEATPLCIRNDAPLGLRLVYTGPAVPMRPFPAHEAETTQHHETDQSSFITDDVSAPAASGFQNPAKTNNTSGYPNSTEASYSSDFQNLAITNEPSGHPSSAKANYPMDSQFEDSADATYDRGFRIPPPGRVTHLSHPVADEFKWMFTPEAMAEGMSKLKDTKVSPYANRGPPPGEGAKFGWGKPSPPQVPAPLPPFVPLPRVRSRTPPSYTFDDPADNPAHLPD